MVYTAQRWTVYCIAKKYKNKNVYVEGKKLHQFLLQEDMDNS